MLQTVEQSFDHKLPPLLKVYEELELGDRFIDMYMNEVINAAKAEIVMDPEACEGLKFEEIAVPIFIPKA